MRYYRSFIDKSDYCYSVDKLVLHGSFLYNTFDEFSARLNALLIKFTCYDEMPFSVSLFRDTYYQSLKKLTYLNNFKFELCQKTQIGLEKSSFWLGTHFQSFDNTLNTWKLEINPNKCMPSDFVSTLFRLLKTYSKFVEVGEYDIAVDLPVSRDSLFLIKDKRKYQSIVNGSVDKTEYLGCRHEHGFCKLYNKQKESKLDFPLTRFEITCTRLKASAVVDSLPTIYIQRGQLAMVDMKLTDTDIFILKTLISEPSRLSELGRRVRLKMREALRCAFTVVVFDFSCISRLVSVLSDLDSFFGGVSVVE